MATQDQGATRTGELLAVGCLVAAAAALVLSLAFPYWTLTVVAPQYPAGLHVTVYANRLEGDVKEIDTLNHYIGMRRLEQGAALERRLAVPGIVAAAVCLLLAARLRGRWAWLLALPAALLPLLFVADLYWWLRDYGLNLDPKAPLNRAIKPFIPTLLGSGKIAQFRSVAAFGGGFYCSLLAGLCAAAGVFLRARRSRRTDRPPAALAAAILILGGGASVEGATLLVGPSGSFTTVQDAVLAASAGDTVLVDGGLHDGPVVVTKPIALIGRGWPVVDGHGRGTVVRLEAPGSVLRGFIIRGSGSVLANEDSGVLVSAAEAVIEENRLEEVLFGIRLHHAPRSVVRRNRIAGRALPVPRRGDLIKVWYSDGVLLEGNRIDGGRDVVLWFSKALALRENRVRGGRYGVHFMYCDGATVSANDLRENSVGIYLMYSRRLSLTGNRIASNRGPSGYGIGLKDMEGVEIADNLVLDNRAGFFLDGASGEFHRNFVAYNDVGVILLPSARGSRFSANSLVENGDQVVVEGLAAIPELLWEGNFWSDYRGFDADGDGSGDQPYEAAQLFERILDRYPALRLFGHSPAAETLEFAARLFPVFVPRPELVDALPRMRPQPPPAFRMTEAS